jgi:hypothetical protein
LLLLVAGCANSDYRFEKITEEKTAAIPMTFDSFYGARDGDVVTAEARFSGQSGDSALVHIRLHLGPPAEFVSGTYTITTGGKTSEGPVTCESLDYQGGQGSVPSMGGRFVLGSSYRVTFPSTPIKRR